MKVAVPVQIAVDQVVETSTAFREYKKHDDDSTVAQFYAANRKNQTVEFVKGKKEEYYSFNHGKYTILELFRYSDEIIDESDPDLSLSQLQHALQTAERARELYPSAEYEWLWLAALIHDLGKVLVRFGMPQWAVVGDTFPVGCRFESKCYSRAVF